MMDFWSLFTRHSNAMEIIQTLGAAAGVCFSIWAMLDALKDAMALRFSGANGPRSVIASGNIITEIERLVIHMILLLVGVASVLLPPPDFQGEPVSSPELLQHTLTRVALISITVVKVSGAMRMRRERNRFVRSMSVPGPGYSKTTTAAELAPPPPGASDPRLQRKDSAEGIGEPRKDEV